MLDQPFQFFVRLRANHQVAAGEKCWDRIDADGGAAAPIVIDGIFKGSAGQHIRGFIRGQAVFLGNLGEDVGATDIFDVDKVGAKQSIGDLLRLVFGLGPFRQLLSKTAVIGPAALDIIGQAFAVHVYFHAVISGDHFIAALGALFGSFRVERELGKLDRQVVIGFEFLDTPGDEITPGSNEIGKDFKNERIRHDRPPYRICGE